MIPKAYSLLPPFSSLTMVDVHPDPGDSGLVRVVAVLWGYGDSLNTHFFLVVCGHEKSMRNG
jgi:hypothetical protein